MKEHWTNIFADSPEESLWEHEWDKHGTCAAELPQLHSEYDYFLQGRLFLIKLFINLHFNEELAIRENVLFKH